MKQSGHLNPSEETGSMEGHLQISMEVWVDNNNMAHHVDCPSTSYTLLVRFFLFTYSIIMAFVMYILLIN